MKIRSFTDISKYTLVLGLLFAPGLVSAATILNGSLATGSGSQNIAVNGTNIDFDFTGAVGIGAGGAPVVTSGTVDGTGDSGIFGIASGTGNLFSLLGTTNTTVHDLNTVAEPTGTMVSLANFITFAAKPTWSITLTEIESGIGNLANCAGGSGTCTPTGSPFNLQNTSSSTVSASFAFLGTFIDTSGTYASESVTGTFGTTFSGTTVQAILAALSTGQAVASSGSGTLSLQPVPEPGTLGMLGTGGFLLFGAMFGRRRFARKES